jgi:hypothetical protein
MRNTYTILVGEPEGKRPLGRPRRGWKDNIRMHVKEIVLEGLDWIYLTQRWNRWLVLCKHGNEPSVSAKGGEFLD